MLPITLDLLTNNRNRPFLRNAQEYAIRQMKGIVAHSTGNTRPGADAKTVRNFFNSSAMFASAHYLVDDYGVLQCIPDNEVAYHVGANKYRPDGERLRGGSSLTPNYFLLGFKICVNEDGNWEQSYRHAAGLAAHLLRKYRMTPSDLYRHHDITGKDCPKILLPANAWSKFKTEVAKMMGEPPKPRLALGRVLAADAGTRTGPGAGYPPAARLRQGDFVEILEVREGWLRLGEERWIEGNFVEIVFQTRLGRVREPTGANVRTGPGPNFPVVDALPKLAFTDITGRQDKWLELGPKRWAYASLIEPVQVRVGAVTGTDALNVRSGPGTDYGIVRRLARGAAVQIFDEQNGWLLTGNSEWIYSGFVRFA